MNNWTFALRNLFWRAICWIYEELCSCPGGKVWRGSVKPLKPSNYLYELPLFDSLWDVDLKEREYDLLTDEC